MCIRDRIKGLHPFPLRLRQIPQFLSQHSRPGLPLLLSNLPIGCGYVAIVLVKPTAQPQRFLNPLFLVQTMYIFKYFFLKCCLLHVFYPPNSSSEIAQEISFRQAHGSFPMKSLLLWQFLTLDEFLQGGPFIILQNDPAL